jgi:hypothetical protein
MRFHLDETILARLRSVQAHRGGHDELAEREDAFLLDRGLGPAIYLTADGRVLLDLTGWDDAADPPVREATDDEAISSLVVGSKKTGVTELLELLPPRPAHARSCSRCNGERWMELGTKAGTSEPGRVVCWDCSGRGWTEPTPSR